ncbi:MAG: Rieske 2Fe-2S domain-containing protein [Woeseiaceae bacterium]|nr:Rieske 2Fe-2S domain-containing protein [Woeseiaceae bacterium]
MSDTEVRVGLFDELADPGCREFSIGDGDWPFRGFVIRQGDDIFAYQNFCVHVGHPLNWSPNRFLTRDGSAIICASHGATYEIETGHCFAGPGSGKSLRKVAVSVRGGVVFVSGPNSM